MSLNLFDYYTKPHELANFNDRVRLIPSLAYKKAMIINNEAKFEEVWPGGLESIAKDPKIAVIYAYRNKKPFPLGEPNIAKFPGPSLFYAKEIINGRWMPGENAIKQNEPTLVKYIDFLKSKNQYPSEGI